LAKNPQSKDEALEAVDFIVNVLKEHERDLDKLINELATVTEQLGDTGELGGKVEKVEEKITTLQKEVASLVSYVSGAPKEAVVCAPKEQHLQTVASVAVQSGPVVILRCKVWEDFQNLAVGAQTLSFSYIEEGKLFQVDALKGNQIINYSGPLPKYSAVLKAFLSKELGVSERSIPEGVLAIG
jgi:hypothetical protein